MVNLTTDPFLPNNVAAAGFNNLVIQANFTRGEAVVCSWNINGQNIANICVNSLQCNSTEFLNLRNVSILNTINQNSSVSTSVDIPQLEEDLNILFSCYNTTFRNDNNLVFESTLDISVEGKQAKLVVIVNLLTWYEYS